MELFTKEQQEKMLKNGSDEYRDQDHPPVVQLILPGTNCCWLLSELEPEYPHIAFGLCDLGFGCPELGYVDLRELLDMKVPPFDFTVYSNPLFEAKYPISVYSAAARANQRIVWGDNLLAQHRKNDKRFRLTP